MLWLGSGIPSFSIHRLPEHEATRLDNSLTSFLHAADNQRGEIGFNGTRQTTFSMKSLLSKLAAFAGFLSLLSSSLFAAPSDTVRLRVDFDRPVLPVASTERLIVKIGLEGLRIHSSTSRQPVNIALVIDRSGSMSGEKLEKAREAAIELVRRLSPGDLFSLITYDSTAQTLISAQHPNHTDDWVEIISSIRPAGSTALHAGVSLGADQVRRHIEESRYVHRVILLSDGQANIGPSSPQALARLGQQLGSEGIAVTTIGLGLDFNEDLMTRLAQKSDGNTYFAESSRDLPRIFESELGATTQVIARSLVVELDFNPGVRPLRFIGREGRITKNHAEIELSQLSMGQEKFALIEVEVPAGTLNDQRQIVEARARFQNLGDKKQVSLSASGRIRFSSDFAEVKTHSNAKIQAEYASNLLAVTRDEAIALADADRKEEAAAKMKESASLLSSLGKLYDNSFLSRSAATANKESLEIATKGIPNATRKAYRADNNQVTNQQIAR